MELDVAITGYGNTRKRLEGAWNNPNSLGDVAVKMATYGSYIADHLGDMKAQYEQERATKYLSHLHSGKSASNAENLARSDTAELRGQIAKIELAHKNLWGLVSVIQSRLRGLENEARNQI